MSALLHTEFQFNEFLFVCDNLFSAHNLHFYIRLFFLIRVNNQLKLPGIWKVDFSSLSFIMFPQIRTDGNVTTSILKLKINRADHGTKLTCRAENPLLPKAILEDIFTFNVACKALLTKGADVISSMLIIREPFVNLLVWKQDKRNVIKLSRTKHNLWD